MAAMTAAHSETAVQYRRACRLLLRRTIIGQCRAVRLYLRLARAAGWHHSFGDGWAWFRKVALSFLLTGNDWLAIRNAAPSLGVDGRLGRER